MTIKKLVIVVIVLISLINFAAAVSSPVQDPHWFYGIVTINSRSMAAGSTITATIGGVEKGSITVTPASQYGASGSGSKLAVTGCGTDEDCYSSTQTISFSATVLQFSDVTCGTATFTAGKLEEKNLACTATEIGGYNPPGPGTASGGPTGGGGGGGGAAAPAAVVSKIKENILADEGGTVIMGVGDISKINIKGIKHEFKLDNIGDDYIEGVWSSDPISVLVRLAQTIETDLGKDGVNDISTKLESISSDKKEATITIKPVKEEIIAPPPPPPPAEKPRIVTAQVVIGLTIMILIVLVGLGIYYGVSRKKKE